MLVLDQELLDLVQHQLVLEHIVSNYQDNQMDLKGPIAIVMGAEGKGMRRLTEDNCDFLCKLPMAGKVECLNVSVATGVCLYEAVRQRKES